MTDVLRPLRDHLMTALDWSEAHIRFDEAVARIPANRRGIRPAGMTHSVWELIEHMRLAQRDLLEFCRNAQYEHTLAWPADYWPPSPTPTEQDWHASIAQLTADRDALRRLIDDRSTELFAKVPTGSEGQTVLRSILLVIDHNAYHLGQLIAVTQALVQDPSAP